MDERGTVLNTQNASGGIVGINTYDAYGLPGPGNIGRFGYTGQMWLPDAQAWHYKARAYHPGLGRFLQTDPIGYGDGLNLYAYVGGDPMNWVDPWGLDGEHIDERACQRLRGVIVVTVSSSVDHNECHTFGVFIPTSGGADSWGESGGSSGASDPTPEEQMLACSTGIFPQYLNNRAWQRQMTAAMRDAKATPSWGPGWRRGSEFAFMSGSRNGDVRIGNRFTSRLATRVNTKVGWELLWIGWGDVLFSHTHQFTGPGTSNSLSDGDFEWARGYRVAIMAERHNGDRYCYDPNT